MNTAPSIAPELYIDTPETLESLCRQLSDSQWLALDTEFIREKTYYPRLCLIQLATPEWVACVDPLALIDLGPLYELLYDSRITKVMHAAQQDLEIFFHLQSDLPMPVFDTQIGATLLGQGEQVGYAALVHAMLDIVLDKSQVRTDWSRRPLSPEQLAYALDDVRYLAKLFPEQRCQLIARDRLDWLEEDFAALTDPARYSIDPDQAWRRIKGHGKLQGVKLAALRALAAWREREAMQRDRPRRWILDDAMILDLARLMPDSPKALGRVRGLGEQRRQRYQDVLLSVIDETRQEPRENWPRVRWLKSLTTEQDALVDVLTAIVKVCAVRHEVSPNSLSNRKELEALVRGESIPLIHGWRAALAGNEIQAFLAGEVQVGLADGCLKFNRCQGN